MISLEKPIAVSRFSKDYLSMGIVVSVILFIIAIIILVVSFSYSPFFFIDPLLCGGFVFILLGGLVYAFINEVHQIKVFEDRFEIKNMLTRKTRKVYFSDFDSYSIITKVDKYHTWDEITVYPISNKPITFKSNYYENENEFLELIIKNKKSVTKDVLDKKKVKKRIYGLLIILLLTSYIAGVIILLKTQSEEVQYFTNKDYRSIQVTLQDVPSYNSKRSELSFEVNEYPEFNWFVNKGIDSTYFQNFIDEKKAGDSITIYIPVYIYKMKIERSIPIPFWEKYSTWYDIEVCGIEDAKYYYLKSETFNFEYSDSAGLNNNIFLMSLNFMGFILLIFLIYFGQDYHVQKDLNRRL